MFTVKDAKIADIKMTGNGCSISQSSASMMTEALKGKALGESEALAKAFKKMMLENGAAEDLPRTWKSCRPWKACRSIPCGSNAPCWPGTPFCRDWKNGKEKQNDSPRRPTPDSVRAVLKTIMDPEIHLSILDLGLIYDVTVKPDGKKGQRVNIRMTLTTPACPTVPPCSARSTRTWAPCPGFPT